MFDYFLKNHKCVRIQYFHDVILLTFENYLTSGDFLDYIDSLICDVMVVGASALEHISHPRILHGMWCLNCRTNTLPLLY
jgi:hypothetical protein